MAFYDEDYQTVSISFHTIDRRIVFTIELRPLPTKRTREFGEDVMLDLGETASRLAMMYSTLGATGPDHVDILGHEPRVAAE